MKQDSLCTINYLNISLPRPENLNSVKDWLKNLPSQGVEPVECGSLLLDAPQVAAIEKEVDMVKVYM